MLHNQLYSTLQYDTWLTGFNYIIDLYLLYWVAHHVSEFVIWTTQFLTWTHLLWTIYMTAQLSHDLYGELTKLSTNSQWPCSDCWMIDGSMQQDWVASTWHMLSKCMTSAWWLVDDILQFYNQSWLEHDDNNYRLTWAWFMVMVESCFHVNITL